MRHRALLYVVMSLASTALMVGCGGDDSPGESDAGNGGSGGGGGSGGAGGSGGGGSGGGSGMPDGGLSSIDARQPSPNATLSFFVTSVGNGEAGGNYGGLSGADARCQELAQAAGAGSRTWRAYLSTADIGVGPVVDARDRIGTGPWFNAADIMIAADVESLHGDGIPSEMMMDELGQPIPREEHDLLTGSGFDGRVARTEDDLLGTCQNWTSNVRDDWHIVGHTDSGAMYWTNAHASRCNQLDMMYNNGSGRLMCFAAD